MYYDGLSNLGRRKVRTVLTSIGVWVGILTVVTMVSLGIALATPGDGDDRAVGPGDGVRPAGDPARRLRLPGRAPACDQADHPRTRWPNCAAVPGVKRDGAVASPARRGGSCTSGGRDSTRAACRSTTPVGVGPVHPHRRRSSPVSDLARQRRRAWPGAEPALSAAAWVSRRRRPNGAGRPGGRRCTVQAPRGEKLTSGARGGHQHRLRGGQLGTADKVDDRAVVVQRARPAGDRRLFAGVAPHRARCPPPRG